MSFLRTKHLAIHTYPLPCFVYRRECVFKKTACSEVLQAGVLEPRTGLEPVTYALRMRRSTN